MMTEDDRLAFSRRLASKTEQNSVRHRKYRLSEKSGEAWVGLGEKVTRVPDPCLPRFSLLRYCRAIFAIALFCSLTSRTGCWRANRLVFFPLNFSHQTNLWIDSTNFRGGLFQCSAVLIFQIDTFLGELRGGKNWWLKIRLRNPLRPEVDLREA